MCFEHKSEETEAMYGQAHWMTLEICKNLRLDLFGTNLLVYYSSN